MELESVEGFVAGLLEYSAVYEDGEEADIYQALRHLLMGVALYDLMGEDDRQLTKKLLRKLQYFFSASFCVKERKRNKEKKIIPPNPLLKEKIKKEKAEKKTEQNTAAGDDVLEGFRKECLRYVGQYGQELVDDFYFHWKQVNRETGKRLFEEKRCFDIDSQLRAWSKSEFTLSKETAALRLQKQKKQQQTNEAVVAAERQQAEARREAEREQDRQRAGGLDEQIAANPDGFLARVQRERQRREDKK